MKKTIHLFCIMVCTLSVSNAQSVINWNAATNLAPSTSGNYHPRIVADSSGDPMVVWNHASRCLFSRWNGTAFTTPVLLNPTSVSVAGAEWMGPDIAAHGDSVYVVYKETPESSDAAHIYCIHSYDGGVGFSSPVRVDYIADSLSRFPTVTTDDAGNPIVGFMKFDASFSDSRWAVTRSDDFGNTFSIDVKASGWSATNAPICDCCPGAVASSDNMVAMVYRDNNANMRDTWAGISTDNGYSFQGGMGIDQQNWLLNACPASGPDAVIIGDTLYSTFMNGASGKNLVYFSKTSILDMAGSTSVALTGLFAGLSQQNYPRIATDGKAMAIAWVQIVNGVRQCVLSFTNNIANGLPSAYEVIDLNDNTNCDVAVSNGKIYIVWEDDAAGTIKYRSGTFTPTSGVPENLAENGLSVFPNPASSTVTVSSGNTIDKILVVNMFGQIIYEADPRDSTWSMDVDHSGIYFLIVTRGQQKDIRKVVVSK